MYQRRTYQFCKVCISLCGFFSENIYILYTIAITPFSCKLAFLSKFAIFVKIRMFFQNSQFLSKFIIFVKIRMFFQNSQFLSKFAIFFKIRKFSENGYNKAKIVQYEKMIGDPILNDFASIWICFFFRFCLVLLFRWINIYISTEYQSFVNGVKVIFKKF